MTAQIETDRQNPRTLAEVVIHFAGDSGDGIQLMGQQFTQASAYLGNDIQTFSDFPAEIRAPAGTLAGVSGFQLMFAARAVHTPGDVFDTLVAFNPAALKAKLPHLREGGILIVDSDKFTAKDWQKAGYTCSPLDEALATRYRLVKVKITQLTFEALKALSLTRAAQRKCKNMLTLGLVYWLYQRPLGSTQSWLAKHFQRQPELGKANLLALNTGYAYAETIELFREYYTVHPAKLAPGTYRQTTGNQALALGCVAASILAKRPLLAAGYPITPASDILQHLASYTQFKVKTFQAEDEIAAIGAALGAAYGGDLGLTCTSGPGIDLKTEMLGLAVMAELPLVMVDVQRAGPSTGMPTKVEQADLLAVIYGRHGECPLPVLAAATPADCFDIMLEAFQVAVKYMTPVIVLSDAYLANSTEPWRLPMVEHLPAIEGISGLAQARPYDRDLKFLTRPWIVPGTPGQMHRIGGLEKAHGTGDISYDPENHTLMVETRAQKIAKVAYAWKPLTLLGPTSGETLVIGWGSTKGSILTVVQTLQAQGQSITAVHLRYLNPLPLELAALLQSFTYILVVELNRGQLTQLLQAQYLKRVIAITKVSGQPFGITELTQRIHRALAQELV
jgi:2-oxoglutarate ferredoxin oxidoreductase subunit alpha